MPQELPDAGKVLFGQVVTEDGFRVMAYDVPGGPGAERTAGSTRREHGMTITDEPFVLSLRGDSLEEVARHWDGLAEGGQVVEPLAASAWSPGFGMLTDRFGVTWAIDVAAD
jgi:PhnB protein